MQSAAPITMNSSSSRACQNCSKAKAKCIPQDTPGDDQCARCFRLKRECIVLPKSTRKRRSPNMAKTTQLEQKIESLVTLLSGTQGILPSPSPTERPAQDLQQEDARRPDHRPAFSWVVEPPRKAKPSWDVQLPLHCGGQHSVTSTPYSSTDVTSATRASSFEGHSTPSTDIQLDNVDNLLKIYRECYEADFPFVVIPPNMTAQDLKSKKPWLASTISIVASHQNRAQQLAMAKQLLMDFALALLVKSEKSLDMLEGLIIFNIWQHYYAQMNPQYQSAAGMQLALAVLYDLSLNKPLRENDGADIISDTFRLTVDGAKEIRRSIEERRAYLSCFIMTSTVSCSLKRIDGLEPTPYLEYTCVSLDETTETESDRILVFMVRSQYLISSMSRLLSGGPGSEDVKAPISMHAKLAVADLQKFFKALPPNLQDHSLVRRSYHSAEIFIHESSLYRFLFPANLSSQRLDMLYACLIAAKLLLDTLRAIPLPSYYGFSIIALSQLGYGLSTVFKLSFIDVPGWDLAYVRSTVYLPGYFDHFITNFEQIGAQIDNSQPTPVKIAFWTGCSRALGRVKGWFEARMAAETEKEQKEQAGLAGIDEFLGAENFNPWDQAFFQGDWEDVMGDFMQQ